MKQYFPLPRNEQKLEWILIILFLLFSCIILIGVFTEYMHLNYDDVLIAALCLSGGFFCIVLGLNGITNGNLIVKYSPFWMATAIQFLLKKIFSFTPDRARRTTAVSLGILFLIVALVMLAIAVEEMAKHMEKLIQ